MATPVMDCISCEFEGNIVLLCGEVIWYGIISKEGRGFQATSAGMTVNYNEADTEFLRALNVYYFRVFPLDFLWFTSSLTKSNYTIFDVSE
jgi:hypothetical protein